MNSKRLVDAVMAFRILSIPRGDDGRLAQEMNMFLRTVRVLAVEKHLLTTAAAPSWTFVFPRLARLRALRKTWAQEAGMPVYPRFTNEQLASIAKQLPTTLTDLRRINGIGESKAATYGERIIAALAEPSMVLVPATATA